MHDKDTNQLTPYQFECFNHDKSNIIFSHVIESEYENTQKSFKERFPPQHVLDFIIKISDAYDKVEYKFKQYIKI